MPHEVLIALAAALVGAFLGGIIVHLVARARSAAAVSAAGATADRAAEALRTELALMAERTRTLERERDEAVARSVEAEGQNAARLAVIDAARADLATTREALVAAETERDALRLTREQDRTSMADLERALTRATGEREEALRDHAVLRTERDALVAQMRQQDAGLAQLRSQLADTTSAHEAERARLVAELRAADVELSRHVAEQEGLVAAAAEAREAAGRERSRADALQGEVQSLAESLARVRAEFASLDERLKQQYEFMATARESLTEQFKAASQDVLKANTAFLTEEAKKALGVEHERIAQRLQPVTDSMGKIEQLVVRVEKERAEVGAALTTQLDAIARSHRELRDETQKLVTALRDPKARGRWGEMQLKRVVEFAGMLEHCDFEEQVTTSGDDGVQRPDLIVRLPGGKCIVVDAKAPLGGYLDAIEATQDDVRDAAMARHATQLRNHVKALADKAYWTSFAESPDMVVLFLPGEAFLQAALMADASLLDDALAMNVMLASPVNLVALLKSVAYGWQQERLAQNAEEIRREAVELVKRVGKLAEHFDAIGSGIRKAADAYNAMHGSFTRRIEPQGRRLHDLGVEFDARLEKPSPVETVLLGSVGDAAAGDATTDTIGTVVPTVLLADDPAVTGDGPARDGAVEDSTGA